MSNDDIINAANSLKEEYNNSAEEYFQEIEDPEIGNEYLARVDAINELLKRLNLA